MKRAKRIEWLHSVPALIAISLGLIYGIGAVSVYGQLKAADLNAVQSMGVVPIEQILGRGIGRMVSQFGQAVVMVALMGLVVAMAYGIPPSAEAPNQRSEERQYQRGPLGWLDRLYSSPKTMLAMLLAVLAFFLVGLPMAEALVYLIAGAATALAFWQLARFTERRQERGSRRAAVIFIGSGLAFIVIFNIAAAFLKPGPLPHARLSTTQGQVLEGGLIAETSGSWYLAQENHSVLVVNARKIHRTFITYPDREAEQSLVDWVLERPPSQLFGGSRNR